ncbi:MAG: hypothetical protein ACLVL7_00670 [Anaerotruncus massiliensis (ex Togo et al. 2019)]
MIVVIAIIAALIALVAPLTRYITNAKELKYEASAKFVFSREAYVAEVRSTDTRTVSKGNDYGTNELNTKGNGIFISAACAQYGTLIWEPI